MSGATKPSLSTPVAPREETHGEGIPNLFCWTKMGVEAGQDLSSILRRKELERQAGDGVFVWGIGNSLGSTIRGIGGPDNTIPVLFSPIQSKPREVDARPAALVVWLSYVDDSGRIRALPRFSLVTSRANSLAVGHQKRHYALLCRSNRSLLEEENHVVDFEELHNATTNKGLGFSQVTALVRRHPRPVASENNGGRKYQVPFRAELFAPFCVRLADGVAMPSTLAEEIAEMARIATASEWAGFVSELKTRAQREIEDSLPLFGGQLSVAWA